MKVSIGLNNFSYTPEAYAYHRYLTGEGWEVELEQQNQLDPASDIHIFFMGVRPRWEKRQYPSVLEVHEYQSLSIPPLAKGKDLLKRYVNATPEARIFLNSFIQNRFAFTDDVPCLHRDMGIDKELFLPPPINPEYDLVYCGSIAGRKGLVDELHRLGTIGLKIIVVGDAPETTREMLRDLRNIVFTGRLHRHEIPGVYQQARAGLNFMPDLYPYNVQTSTKVLEYCAAGLGIVSSRYNWISSFAATHKFEPLWLSEIGKREDLDAYRFNVPDVTNLEWNALLERVRFGEFLKNVLNKGS